MRSDTNVMDADEYIRRIDRMLLLTATFAAAITAGLIF